MSPRTHKPKIVNEALLWVFLQCIGSLPEKCTTLMNESSAFQLFIFCSFRSPFHFSFHSERALHIKKKSSIRRTYVCTHHKTLSCLLLCCIFEGSKNHDPKRKLRYTPASRCKLAVGSEQKLYYFCYDSNQDNCHP